MKKFGAFVLTLAITLTTTSALAQGPSSDTNTKIDKLCAKLYDEIPTTQNAVDSTGGCSPFNVRCLMIRAAMQGILDQMQAIYDQLKCDQRSQAREVSTGTLMPGEVDALKAQLQLLLH